MDPITIWTALGVLVIVGGGVIGLIRKGDSERIQKVEDTVSTLSTQVAEKAAKDELARVEARFEKEFESVRSEQRSGFAEIRQDLKDMRHELMTAIKDMVNK